MAKVTIGGVDHEVPPFSYRQLKLAWPHITSASNADSDNLPQVVDAILTIVAIGLTPTKGRSKADIQKDVEEQFQKFEESFEPSEMGGLQKSLRDIMDDSGLIAKKKAVVLDGKDVAGNVEAEDFSTATSIQ